jgi:PAS domain S-box-containing protein
VREDGRIVQLHGVVQDITRRKATKRRWPPRSASSKPSPSRCALPTELRRSETRYADAMEAANDGLWEANLQTGQVFTSPMYSRMLGFEPGELGCDRHSAWLDLVHPDERAFVAESGRMLSDTGHYELEFRMRGKDGGYRWILSRGMVVERDAAGRPLRAVGTHVDLTARKAMELELRAARDTAEAASRQERLPGQHEPRAAHPHERHHGPHQPGAAPRRRPEAARPPRQDRPVLPAAPRPHQRHPRDQQHRVAAHHPRRNRLRHRGPAVAAARRDRRPGRRQGPHPAARPAPAITALALRGDEKRLRQVLAKLLGNAIKFTAAGAITLRIHRLDGTPAQLCLRFEIQDTGIGIAPDDIKRLFSAFEQADNSPPANTAAPGWGWPSASASCT